MSAKHSRHTGRPTLPARCRILCLILCLFLVMSTVSAGCGRVFDRSAYIRAMLDAVYHMEYDTLAQLRST